MRFVVDRVTLGQVLLAVLRFSPFSVFPSVLQTHFQSLGASESSRIAGRVFTLFPVGRVDESSPSSRILHNTCEHCERLFTCLI